MSTQGDNEQFTGLILLSGVDKPGITQALFETLSPFSITILDIEQVVIKDRLILTTLIALNPAHQNAISQDLTECALALDVDIATLFAYAQESAIANKPALMHVVILSKKIEPAAIADISSGITSQAEILKERLALLPIQSPQLNFLSLALARKL